MIEERRKRHAPRVQIVKQRSSLPLCQVGPARDEHAQLFEQLARPASDHRCALSIGRILHAHKIVAHVALPARKSMKAAEESQLQAAPHPEDLSLARSILAQKYHRRRILRR